MSIFQQHAIPAVAGFSVKAEYLELFGAANATPSPRNIADEWEIYVIKEVSSPALIGGTLYRLSCGDVLLVPPFESVYFPDESAPLRSYRLLIEKVLIERCYPTLAQLARFRRARFVVEEDKRTPLFSLCEDLLSKKSRALPLYSVLSLFELLRKTDNRYTEEDELLESYEVCLPISLKKAMLYIRNNHKSAFSLKSLADDCRIGGDRLRQLFKTHLSLSPKQYLTKVRMLSATEMLLYKDSVSEVASLLSYRDASRFSHVFYKTFGTTPSQYVKSGGIVFR